MYGAVGLHVYCNEYTLRECFCLGINRFGRASIKLKENL